MKIVVEGDGTLEIRPESPFENYALRKWFEDWLARRVVLRVSWKDGSGSFTKEEVVGAEYRLQEASAHHVELSCGHPHDPMAAAVGTQVHCGICNGPSTIVAIR